MRVLAIFAFAASLYFGSPFYIPLVSGYFLFLLLDPFVEFGTRWHVSRTAGSIVMVSFSVIVFIALSFMLYNASTNIAKQVPNYSAKIRALTSQIQQKAKSFEKSSNTIIPKPSPPGDVQKVQVVEGYGKATQVLLRGINTIFEGLAYAIFIPLLALFLLLDKAQFGEVIGKICPASFSTRKIAAETEKMVRGYFVGNVIIGLVMAVVLGAEYLILGLNDAIPLALATGFLNLIPFVGPFISLVLPLAAGLLQFNNATPFIIISVSVVTLHLIVTNIIVPKVVGSQIAVNAFAATLGLLFWGWIWGAIGLLLAVPLTALIKIILEDNTATAAWSAFLAERPHPHKNGVLRKLLVRRFERA